MPIMPRTDKKATKIVYNILGTPGNMQKKRYKKPKEKQSVKTESSNEEFFRVNSD